MNTPATRATTPCPASSPARARWRSRVATQARAPATPPAPRPRKASSRALAAALDDPLQHREAPGAQDPTGGEQLVAVRRAAGVAQRRVAVRIARGARQGLRHAGLLHLHHHLAG